MSMLHVFNEKNLMAILSECLTDVKCWMKTLDKTINSKSWHSADFSGDYLTIFRNCFNAQKENLESLMANLKDPNNLKNLADKQINYCDFMAKSSSQNPPPYGYIFLENPITFSLITVTMIGIMYCCWNERKD